MKTFNKALVAILLASVVCSCKTMQNYYQIAQTKPMDATFIKCDDADKGYYYEDLNCRISYNFWSEKGDAGFTVTNLTDQVLYILKDKCFFIKDGVSYDYYHGREWADPVVAGKATATDKEQTIIGIAPHTSRSIGNYEIYGFVLVNCDLDRKPAKNKPASISFSPENSPVQFGNFITYRVGNYGAEQSVKNMFYTWRVTNYRKDDLFYTEKITKCPNVSDIKEMQESIIRFAPATGYYITYVK